MTHSPSRPALLFILAVVAPAVVTAQRPQAPAANSAPARPPGVVSVADATELTNGWALLAEGRAAQALVRADRVLAKDPRSAAAIALALEAEIMRGGPGAGLARYEQWLGDRPNEEPALVRRIARAVLTEEAARSREDAARVTALRALADAGDEQAARDAAQLAASKDLSSPGRAALGNEAAVRALVAQLKSGGPGQVRTIETLAASGSPLAVEAVAERLQDQRSEIRAAAATALGSLGDQGLATKIAPLLQDTNVGVRVAAAGSLLKLGDYSGLDLLNGMMADPEPATRILAAEALAARPDGSWVAQVRELAAVDDPEIRAAAARLLGPHDPEFASAVLNALSTDANPAIRELAALSMGEVVTTNLAELRRLLRSESALTRAKAGAQVLAVTR